MPCRAARSARPLPWALLTLFPAETMLCSCRLEPRSGGVRLRWEATGVPVRALARGFRAFRTGMREDNVVEVRSKKLVDAQAAEQRWG